MKNLPFLFSSEIFRLLQIGFGVMILFSVSEIVRRRYSFTPEFTRKFVHLGVGLFILFSPLIFLRKNPVLVISAFFTLADLAAYRLGFFPAVHGADRRSYGTVYYPLALFILTALLWDTAPAMVAAAMMPMAFGDAAAGIAGSSLSKPRRYALTRDPKSIEGSAVMFLASLVALFALLLLYNGRALGLSIRADLPFLPLLLCFMSISLFATAWEAISARGSDNLTVPLAAAFGLQFCLSPAAGQQMEQFILANAFALLLALAALWFRLLSASGAVATYILAVVIFSIGGWSWTLPILTFFLFSSLLSRIGSARKRSAEEISLKGAVRDYQQVVANGGIPGAAILGYYLTADPAWGAFYLGAVAAAAADTWSSEIGLLSGTDPRNILTGRREPAGTSGAVSILGFLGGAAGAAAIGISALPFSTTGMLFPGRWLPIAAVCLAGGMVGTAVDSLLGASLQARFRCGVCGISTEKKSHCGNPTSRERGVPWMNNDLVNLLCGLAGAVAGWTTWRIF